MAVRVLLNLMESYRENGRVFLRRDTKNLGATRIIKKPTNEGDSRAFSVSGQNLSSQVVLSSNRNVSRISKNTDLTNKDFSVTRAHAPVRAHAYAHAREYSRINNRVVVGKDNNLGLKRVLDAVLTGGDVKVAAIEPMSFTARLIAFLLIPVMLISPLVPAYANEAPLADRVASDVAAAVGNTSESIAANSVSETVTAPAENTNQPSDNQSAENTNPTTPASDASKSESSQGGDVAGVSDEKKVEDVSSQPEVSGGSQTSSPTEASTSTEATTPTSNNTQENKDTEKKNETVVDSPKPSEPREDVVQNADENNVQILDVPSQDVQEDLQTLRSRLREEVKAQVRNELKKEIEREVYAGCKNLDGTGYYCIPDAKSFGSAAVSQDNSVTAVVQQDPLDGDKEIFLVRNGVAVQLTHNSDDDVFPVLDPASDLLVWQSLVKGHWQIAFAHVSDPGVPQIFYLTSSENNFNPKVYRGRIVWQAWVDGNWEVFTVTKAKDIIEDDALTAEHRAVKVDGKWNIRRITANNVPDMFPTVTSDAITWQSMDEGVWQVFSYDLETGTSRRVSKKGVKSESPRTALVWAEEDGTGQMRLVGSDVNNSENLDFTALARRVVDQSKDKPKAPVSTTEVVVEKPTTVRTEDEIQTVPTSGN